MPLAIGVDVGGTKIAAGVVDEDGVLHESTQRVTPAQDSGKIESAIVDMVRQLAATHSVECVGVSAAGYVAADRSTVTFAANLAWRNTPLRRMVEDSCQLPAVIENDGNAAAWGEARFGAGRGEENLVALTLGTGLGGGIILNGRLVRGHFGAAAEVGHRVVESGGRQCGCGSRGCLDVYASGSALAFEAYQLAVADPPRAGTLLKLAGGDPENITGSLVAHAALSGDEISLEAFERLGGWLAKGMADVASLFDPALFVIGGGVSRAGELLLGPTNITFARLLAERGHPGVAKVRLAELGELAGVVGVADLARLR